MIINQTGGGAKINGIIEQYRIRSGTDISAGDFVHYINGLNEPGAEVNISDVALAYKVQAVKISEDKVLLLYYFNERLYGIVCTLRDTVITTGILTMLMTIAPNDSSIGYDVVYLEDNKVFVASGYSSNYKIRTSILTVDGVNITYSLSNLINDDTYISTYFSSCLIGDNKVLVSYSDDYTYGIVCTISGTTCNPGTKTRLDTRTDTSQEYASPTITRLEEDKFLVVYRGRYGIYGNVCTVNDTTITVGAATTIGGTSALTDYMRSELLATNKVLLLYRVSPKIYSIVINVDGTTITKGAAVELIDTIEIDVFSFKVFDTDKALVIYYGIPESCYTTVCIISALGTTITAGESISMTGVYYGTTNRQYAGVDAVIVDQNTGSILLAYKRSNGLFVLASYLEEGLVPYSNIITGVAKQGGSGGDTIGVYVPPII